MHSKSPEVNVAESPRNDFGKQVGSNVQQSVVEVTDI